MLATQKQLTNRKQFTKNLQNKLLTKQTECDIIDKRSERGLKPPRNGKLDMK